MPYQITYTITDNDGDEANTSIYVPVGNTIANYQEFAWRYALTIQDFIFGIFRGLATLRVPIDISGLTGNVASADSDVEQIALFEFDTTNPNSGVGFTIPALNELDILLGTDELDQSDPNIAAVISMFEDGLTITGAVVVQPTNLNSEDIISTKVAFAATRNSGKRRR